MDSEKPAGAQVRITSNGPYLVAGKLPLRKQTIGTNTEGESVEWVAAAAYPEQAQYALCRCGHSGHKPFCDGSHARVDFDGTETASRRPYLEQAQRIPGPAMSLTDVEALCASARFCDPMARYGTWSANHRSRQRARILPASAVIAPRAALWPGTMPPASRWSRGTRLRWC